MITDPIALAVDFFKVYTAFWAVFTALEFFFPADKKQKWFSRHTLIDLFYGLLNQLLMGPLNAVFSLVLIVYVLDPYVTYRPFQEVVMGWPLAVQFLMICLVTDLAQYTAHRLMHTFVWSCHVTHHSATELRSSTHWRFHPIDFALLNLSMTAFAHVLGFESEMIIWAQVAVLVNNMWIHTNVNVSYGPVLSYILVSPNYHKWHHAQDVDAQDKNYAVMFAFLDVLGRSYYYPRGKTPAGYGLMGVATRDPLHQSYLGTLIHPVKEAWHRVAPKKGKDD